MNFENLSKLIEDADIITIFRHQHPDCDALGSQHALSAWLKMNYPKKEVYVLGNEKTDQTVFPESDIVEDMLIQNSLAIVLDTANKERVDDQRFLSAKYILKIDHHPNRDAFGNCNYVFEEAAATCEILTKFFSDCSDKVIDFEIAEYLYKGLLTDTLCFRTSNTTAHTLEMAAKLAGYGINIPQLNRELFDKPYAIYQFCTWIRLNIKTLGEHFAYVMITKDTLDSYNLKPSTARNYIDELGHVKEFAIWAIFTENDKEKYDGSLRSKEIVINQIANQYGGGGHKNACGVKNLTPEQLKNILADLHQASLLTSN